MKVSQCRFFGAGFAVVFVLLLLSENALFAQANSWIGSGSGDWESPEWSLGLPGTNEDIYITNAGSKVIVIEPTTVQNYPQTMTVNSITIDSPADTTNTLFLNNAGLESPLSLTSLNVGSNSSVVMGTSSLEAAYALNINGTFTQDASSIVTADSVGLGDTSSGLYDFESGILNASNETINLHSLFLQQGGTNAPGEVHVASYQGGEFDLNGGELDSFLMIFDGGLFKQTGGVINLARGPVFDGQTLSSINLDGSLIQSGGIINGTNADATGMTLPMTMALPLDSHPTTGTVLQTGGTNCQNSLTLGTQTPLSSWDNSQYPTNGGTYTLSNGYLATGNTYVWSVGRVEQSGGIDVISGTLILQASIYLAQGYPDNIVINHATSATYLLSGGELEVSNVSISVESSFVQSGGTNIIRGNLSYGVLSTPLGPNGAIPALISGSYLLQRGLLSVRSLTVNAGGRFILSGGELTAQNISGEGYFPQTGGTNEVGKLSADYTLSGGLLVADNVQLTNGSAFQHTGGECTVSLLSLDNGIWQEDATGQVLGQLQLGAGTNSILELPTNVCEFRFADSSSLNWSNTGVLTIVNWNGFLSGGGSNQIVFGNSSNALTAQQLSQIQFANPAGLAAGNYLAKILSTGEIVPDSRSFLDGAPAPFFTGEAALGSDWFYLSQSNAIFGYYYMAQYPYVYHVDMGWEYFEDAADGHQGAYFYDFTDGAWFYTQPSFFPFLYDFKVNAWMYYDPLEGAAGRYTSDPRWFYNLSTQAWGKHL